MTSVTIRDVPPPLHRALKERAARNRRSLQSEIVATLEQTIRPRPVPVDQILDRANRFRAAVKIKTTDEEIRRFKRGAEFSSARTGKILTISSFSPSANDGVIARLLAQGECE